MGLQNHQKRKQRLMKKLPDAPETLVSLAKQEKIESFYKYLEDNGYRVDKAAHLKHKALFQ